MPHGYTGREHGVEGTGPFTTSAHPRSLQEQASAAMLLFMWQKSIAAEAVSYEDREDQAL